MKATKKTFKKFGTPYIEKSPHPTPRSRRRTVKAWAALDIEGKMHCWLEGRYAIYSATHGKDISLQRSKQPQNFVVIPCTITYTLPTIKSSKRRRKV